MQQVALIAPPHGKPCARCKEWKPLDAFAPAAKGPQGRSSYCRPCAAGYASAKGYGRKTERWCNGCKQRLPSDRFTGAFPFCSECTDKRERKVKTCTQCKVDKPRAEFSKNKSYVQSKCKECAASVSRAWHKQNAARVLRGDQRRRLAVHGTTPDEQEQRIADWFGSPDEWARYLEWRLAAERRRKFQACGYRFDRLVEWKSEWDGKTCSRCNISRPPGWFRSLSSKPTWNPRVCRACLRNAAETLTAYRCTKAPLGAGWVYVVRTSRLFDVKIGFTSSIDSLGARLKHLQTGNNERLELLGIMPGGRQLEKALHYQFEHLSVDGGGEWFRWHPDIEREVIPRLRQLTDAEREEAFRGGVQEASERGE